MRFVSIFLLAVGILVSSAFAKDWIFRGSIVERSDWEKSGTNWTTVFIKIDTQEFPLDEFRLVYSPSTGVLDLERSCWMHKPMPTLKCPMKIPPLITATNGKPCTLIFEVEKWDWDSRDKGEIRLKSLEWIPVQQPAPANGASPRR